MQKPTIIVIAFNRPSSLNRLLKSLDNASYKKDNVCLVISIDFQDSEEHRQVVEVAKNFNWKYGTKKIVIHTENLGLKIHVLSCGDMVNIYDNIIVLEDDLYVSPCFYEYATQALCFYESSDEIGGISLYNHKRNFLNTIPFETIPDSYDIFFLQIASSWGQAWSKKQWQNFKTWYKNKPVEATSVLPKEVKNWPESSWLKYYISYLVSTEKFFVYPNKSLTTNFGDSGTNNLDKNAEYQVPLFYIGNYNFIDIDKSLNVYDVYFEILPSKLKSIAPSLKDFDFSIDLYGKKELNKISSKFLLSSKEYSSSPIKSFGLEFKPLILNILHESQGKIFHFGKKHQFKNGRRLKIENPEVFNYFYTKISFVSLFRLLLNRFNWIIKKIINS